MAFANSLVDVALNVQGVELERRERRPLLARLVERHGRRRVIRAAAAIAAAGIAGALLAPGPITTLAGWAALGAGLAPIAPAVLGAAPRASRLSAPAAIAAVTTVGYLGSFTGPPLIGALATPLGLTGALGLLILAALAAGALA